MESFLKKVWDTKAWTISTIVLTFCLSEIATSFAEIRQIARNQLEFSIEAGDSGAEMQRQNDVLDLYESSINDLKPLLDHYMSTEQANSHISVEDQKTGVVYSMRTSERLRTLYAKSAGIRLSCKECRDLHKELLTGMTLSVDLSKGFSAFISL